MSVSISVLLFQGGIHEISMGVFWAQCIRQSALLAKSAQGTSDRLRRDQHLQHKDNRQSTDTEIKTSVTVNTLYDILRSLVHNDHCSVPRTSMLSCRNDRWNDVRDWLIRLILWESVFKQSQLEEVALATHCNWKAARRRASRSGLFFGKICTVHAQKLLFPSFYSKFRHRRWIRRPRFPTRYRYFTNQWDLNQNATSHINSELTGVFGSLVVCKIVSSETEKNS